ncbi:MAG: hypothetical protein RIQ93_1418 [Verrucomicrobiota bacterium]|jgi:hypothetical protein
MSFLCPHSLTAVSRCAGFLAMALAFAPGPVAAGPAYEPPSHRVLDLPPGPGNPRNSEGAFVELRDGRILFVYSRFLGESHSDHAKATLAARTSRDDGATWSDDAIIATPREAEAMNVMSVSLLRLQNGAIGMFYMLRISWHDMRMYLRRSADEGRSWSEPVVCMPEADYHVVNNDRVVRLSSGRLIIPAALHKSLAARNEQSAVDFRGIAKFFLSDDDGLSWRGSVASVRLPIKGTKRGMQEPGLVELPGGRLWGWARTDQGRQYQIFSNDGGDTWTEPEPSRFTSPTSPLSMKRIPGSDRFLAIWNPARTKASPPLVQPGGDRIPLVMAMGATPDGVWSKERIIEGPDEPTAGYCYTAIHFTKSAVLLAYCAGGEADKHRLARLRIRRIPLAQLQW